MRRQVRRMFLSIPIEPEAGAETLTPVCDGE